MYTALIHRPGCLPDTAEPPPEFDTPAEAWHYLAEQRATEEDHDPAEASDTARAADQESSSTYQQLMHCANRPTPTAGWDGTGTIHGPTPGADTLGDLGWCYTVEAITEPPDCQTPGHDHSAHDTNGTSTTGPSRCPQCRALCHFDDRVGDYQHDGPTIPDCFLIRRHPAAVPCLRPGTNLDTTPRSTGLPQDAAAPTHSAEPLTRIRWTRTSLKQASRTRSLSIVQRVVGWWMSLGVSVRSLTRRGRSAGPRVRRLLDMSTQHIPPHILEDGLHTVSGLVVYSTRYGWLMWVPADPAARAAEQIDPPPAALVAIQRYARRYGCDFVLFDADADTDPHLPLYPQA